ncbi:MAG: RagB/SusD family nutrient uptake outer membrane protein [Myxococcales bacterium]|nr:RagB/SusD family nutrient uptake outer membrane protein [Myxococcales bacterium]
MRKLSIGLCSVVALATLNACDFEIGDLNNPSLDELEDSPTLASISAACAGIMAGHRGNLAAANGYISLLGILGRESYNFDGADPRYFGEMLTGALAKGSPFGGNFWAGPYANIRLANIVIKGVDKVAAYSAEERSAIKGYARTFIAMDLLRVINTRDTIGAVVDTDKELGAPLAPIVDKPVVYAAINSYLDMAKADLMGGGMAFPFTVPSGFSAFGTPASFLRFNRAMRARVALYADDAAGALTALGESFLKADLPAGMQLTLADLNIGPTMVFSANANDTANGLTNRNIWAHPDLVIDAKMNGSATDLRLARKTFVPTTAPTSGTAGGVSSNRKFAALSTSSTATAITPTSPIALIRNEELILLRAEARFKTGAKALAVQDLNVVRTLSGGLAALAEDIPDAEVTNEILYNRRYSLMFEGGHRWIDARRFNRVADLKPALPNHVVNLRFPIPQAECDARKNEPKCNITSQ